MPNEVTPRVAGVTSHILLVIGTLVYILLMSLIGFVAFVWILLSYVDPQSGAALGIAFLIGILTVVPLVVWSTDAIWRHFSGDPSSLKRVAILTVVAFMSWIISAVVAFVLVALFVRVAFPG